MNYSLTIRKEDYQSLRAAVFSMEATSIFSYSLSLSLL